MRTLRLLYSFPDTVGKPGIGTTAQHQIAGLTAQGHTVIVSCTSSVVGDLGARSVHRSLELGGRRIPHRAVGRHRAYRHHDRRTAALVRSLASRIDLVHVWPGAAWRTAEAARALGLPVVREVPNTHTAYAYEAVEAEHRALGLEMPAGHSHTRDDARLRRESAEYHAVDFLLVPSEFSRRTFVERGLPEEKLVLHRYGFDPARFSPSVGGDRSPGEGLRAVFIGRCEPRKGLHHALRAWIDSGAAERGRLLIAGRFVPGYREALARELEHPSVEVRGFVEDTAALMREADLLVMPSVEEGSALVTYEAQACGCALLVSEATGARCIDGRHGLVHRTGDVGALTEHLRRVDLDRSLLAQLRRATLEDAGRLTWAAAGVVLAEAYATCLERSGGAASP